jgi:protein-disulfide isomerase
MIESQHERCAMRFASINWRVLGAVILAVSIAAACARDKAPANAEQGNVSSSTTEFPRVLATIGDEPITFDDVKARAGGDLDKIETQYRIIRSRIVEAALDSLLRERTIGAEAKRQGKSIDELVRAEAGASANPTDADAVAWYMANSERIGGRPIESIRSQILDLLRAERLAAAADRLQNRLTKERKVRVNFTPYRLSLDNKGAPTAGRDNAPVTLVEFSDFQCPFCSRFVPTLKKVEEKFGDRVKIVYRQFPLTSIHPAAFKAAEASLCAHEHGKFWQMHDAMFADQKKLGVSDLKATAATLGLDRKKFDTCLDTGRYTEQVQHDLAEGQRLGITGTPAIFINGVELRGGAVPYETVAAAIDRELARSQPK